MGFCVMVEIQNQSTFQERGPRQKDLLITPDSLWQDNHSLAADANREGYDQARMRGELIAYYRCSDARIKPPGKFAISWGSIAAANEPISQMASHKGIQASVALAHFDGDTAQPGMVPNGCGGLAAKEQMENDGSKKEGIGSYIEETVAHPDVVIQAWISAEKIASLSGKPTLAAAQDHLDLTIYPLALFIPAKNDMSMSVTTAIGIRNIIQGQYNPKEIYARSVPTIDEKNLPDFFVEIFEQNRKDQKEIHLNYPNLRELQKVQKPRMVLVSTDIRSARVRYPKLSSVPGSIFKVHMPREKTDGVVTISSTDTEKTVNQLQYPLEHAVKNYTDQSKPFSNTDRLIIETGNLELSRRITQRTMKETWMRDWIDLPDRKIIIIQTIGGVTNAIEYFKPNAL